MSDVNVVIASGKISKISTRMVTFGEGDEAVTNEMTTFGVMSIEAYQGREKKTLVKCVAWGKELNRELSFMGEGDMVVVQGKLSNRKGKEDDQWVTEVTVSKVSLVGEGKRTEPLPF